ncbi:MAG: LiaI-LiaF-like domain-containing protein [Dehalococcoidia bacterium]
MGRGSVWKAFVGLALIALGTLLLLERLGVVERALAMWWPAFLIALGLAVLVQGLLRR